MRGSNPLVTKSAKGRGLEPLAAQHAKEDHFVLACIRIVKKHRISDPFKLAKGDGWTRERWDTALARYQAKQWKQMQESGSEGNDDE